MKTLYKICLRIEDLDAKTLLFSQVKVNPTDNDRVKVYACTFSKKKKNEFLKHRDESRLYVLEEDIENIHISEIKSSNAYIVEREFYSIDGFVTLLCTRGESNAVGSEIGYMSYMIHSGTITPFIKLLSLINDEYSDALEIFRLKELYNHLIYADDKLNIVFDTLNIFINHNKETLKG